jgi:hypothetical protein
MSINKGKNKEYHIVGTIPNSNIKTVEKARLTHMTNKYMTAHFPGWYMNFNKK